LFEDSEHGETVGQSHQILILGNRTKQASEPVLHFHKNLDELDIIKVDEFVKDDWILDLREFTKVLLKECGEGVIEEVKGDAVDGGDLLQPCGEGAEGLDVAQGQADVEQLLDGHQVLGLGHPEPRAGQLGQVALPVVELDQAVVKLGGGLGEEALVVHRHNRLL
jgi:hypothetical protein